MSGTRIYVRSATIKATGERINYLAKQSWGVRYYSFDDGVTWHRTKSAAFRARASFTSITESSYP